MATHQAISVPSAFPAWDQAQQQVYLEDEVSFRELTNFIREVHGLEPRDSHRFLKHELAKIAAQKVNDE